MSDWRDINRDSWSFAKDLIVGADGGIGEYLTSYTLDLGHRNLLNGRISAEIELAERHATGAGIVCRADEQWTFLAFYTAPSTLDASTTRARLGVWKEGVFTPIFTSPEEIVLDAGFNRFSLEFVSGDIRATIATADRTYRISHCCPHVPFAGCAGLVKLYGASVRVRDVRIEAIDTPWSSHDQRDTDGYAWDVFICHSSRDKPAVLELVDELERQGIRCWIDSEQIAFGDPITQRIEDGLRRSRYIVPVLTANLTAQAKWTRAEYGAYLGAEFAGAQVRVIPLKLDGCANEDIPPLLADKKRVTRSNKAEFSDFVSFLKH